MPRVTSSAPPPQIRERQRVRRRREKVRWWRSRYNRRRIWRVVRNVLILVGLLLVIGAIVSVIAVAYAAPAVVRARRDGRTLVTQGRDAILRNDPAAARLKFSQATSILGAAENRLRSPLFWPARLVPIVGTNIVVTRDIASVGRQISEAGYSLATSVQRLPGGSFRITKGGIPIGSIAAAADALDAGAAVASDISDQVANMPTGWVVPQVARLRTEVHALVPGAADAIAKAQAAMHGLPNVLGQNKFKRYLIAFSNLSELRGSGGLIGYVTALDAYNGKMHLEKLSGFPTTLFPQPGKNLTFPSWFPDDFKTQAQLLQNINMTTDFPTVGNLLLQAVQKKTKPMDGVIAVDPEGVAAVLSLTGPIHVQYWRPAITASNVAQLMQHDIYTAIPDRAKRDAFFAVVVRAAFEKLTTQNITIHPRTVGAFDAAVEGGHFRMYSNDGNDEAMFKVVGLAGNVDRAAASSDALSVVSENSSGNKEDWYLTKNYRYTVRLDPRRGIAETLLDVDLHNAAPSGGQPDYVIGAKAPGLSRGTNRLTFMLLRSARDQLKAFAIGGHVTNVLGASESGLRAYRTGVEIPPGGDARIDAISLLPNPFFGPRGSPSFRLNVLPQAMAHPDSLDVRFVAAPGWRIVGPSRSSGTVDRDLVFDVRLVQTRRGAIIHELTAPFRLARRALHHFLG